MPASVENELQGEENKNKTRWGFWHHLDILSTSQRCEWKWWRGDGAGFGTYREGTTSTIGSEIEHGCKGKRGVCSDNWLQFIHVKKMERGTSLT